MQFRLTSAEYACSRNFQNAIFFPRLQIFCQIAVLLPGVHVGFVFYLYFLKEIMFSVVE